MDINLNFPQPLHAEVERLKKAWELIPKDKEPLYAAVFWIARFAKEMLAARGNTPAQTVSLQAALANDLLLRFDGFRSEFKLNRAAAVSEIDRVSNKLKSIGWYALDLPFAEYLAKCDTYRGNLKELKQSLAQGDGQ